MPSPAITAACRARFASRPSSGSRRASSRRSSPRPRSKWASTSATSTWSARSARRDRSPRCCSASAGPGHSLGKIPKGRLFPLTRDELLECLALVRAVRRGELDRIEIPEQPLDILAQQIVASVACEEWDEDALFTLLPAGVALSQSSRRRLRGHRRRCSAKASRPKSRAAPTCTAIRSIAACGPAAGPGWRRSPPAERFPRTAFYRVVAEPEGTFVGTLDEDFAVESLAGDVFLLGNTSWRIKYVRGGEVQVRDAEGAPPTIPFWLGEAPGPHRRAFGRDFAAPPRHGRRAVPQGFAAGEPRLEWLKPSAGADVGQPSRRCGMSKPKSPPSAWCRRKRRSSSSGSSTNRAACSW